MWLFEGMIRWGECVVSNKPSLDCNQFILFKWNNWDVGKGNPKLSSDIELWKLTFST